MDDGNYGVLKHFVDGTESAPVALAVTGDAEVTIWPLCPDYQCFLRFRNHNSVTKPIKRAAMGDAMYKSSSEPFPASGET